MSANAEKFAEARARGRALTIGNLFVCRGCDCDDNNACLGADGQPCHWVVLDVATPTGICSACAERLGWSRFFFSSPDFVDAKAQAA